MKDIEKSGLIVAGAVLIWLYFRNKASAAGATAAAYSTVPAGYTPLPLSMPGTATIVVMPGPMSEGIPLGTQIVLQLQPNCSWTSSNGVPLSGNAPITWTYQGPGTITLGWTDIQSQPQTTQVTFYTNAF